MFLVEPPLAALLKPSRLFCWLSILLAPLLLGLCRTCPLLARKAWLLALLLPVMALLPLPAVAALAQPP
jgi:hypothetical protein